MNETLNKRLHQEQDDAIARADDETADATSRDDALLTAAAIEGVFLLERATVALERIANAHGR